jgi:orotate phosphoribosyltransferase
VISATQRDFLTLLVTREALRFGDFTLKSGRRSPYFINTGCFHRGSDLAVLGAAYAATVQDRFGDGVDVVFGPAYKGIPLALATAAALESRLGRPVDWTYDRKEAKTHGDGGAFVGAALGPGRRVVIVDDVLTAGTAMRESLEKLRPTGATIVGAVVAVDRQERGAGNRTALQEIAAELGVVVAPIITITEAAETLVSMDIAGRRYLTPADRARIATHLLAP